MLDKANVVGKELSQNKNDYETGGIFCGLFVAPEKYCSTIDENKIIKEHKTFKGFNENKRLPD